MQHDFIITKAAGVTVFTPVSFPAAAYWEERWENVPSVGSYGWVRGEPAGEIEVDLRRKGFRLLTATA